MKKQGKNPEVPDSLRKKAEEQLKSKQTKTSLTFSEPDMLKLIHELEVHQIELEMQNEELVLAKEKAELAEEKYTELYDFAPSGYFTLSRQGKILEMNLRGAQMLGKGRSFLINSQLEFCIKEDSRIVFANFLEEIFQGKNKANCDVPFRCADNNGLYVHLTGIISEKKEQCFITATDITERKKAEEELKKNLAKYEVLINTFPIAITLSDKEGNIVETNEKALELLGLHREEHLKRKLKGEEWKIIKTDGTIFPQDEYASVKALKENRLVENVEMGIVKSTEDITWLNVTAAPIPVEDFGVVIAYNDITERKKAEDALENSMQMLEKTMYSLLDAVLIIDADTVKIMDCNPAASTIFGYSRQEMLGQTTEFLHVDEASLEVFRQHLNSDMKAGKEFMFLPEFKMKHKDGTLFFSEHSVVPLKNKLGQRIGWVSVVRDITERKNAELALIQSELFANTIASSTPALLYLYDFEKKENIWSNDAHKRFFEEINKNAGGMQFADIIQLIHPDDIKSAVAHQSELTDAGSVSRFNTEIRIIAYPFRSS